MKHLIKVAVAIALTALINMGNAFALTSNGDDGALILNNSLILKASNNQVFNYSVVDLQANSILDFSGLNSGDSVFILGTGDLTLNGTINLPSFTSFTFETSGNILFAGSVLTSNSNVSFISNAFQSSSTSLISDIGGSISITAETNVVINGKIDVGGISTGPDPSTPVISLPIEPIKTPIIMIPEPSSYVLLTLGLLALTSRYRRLHS
ncbi:MAG TPA: PEP-CTERM sorting domain-containing protein [Methylophilaceae bacterium]|jgi:hypothetical protein